MKTIKNRTTKEVKRLDDKKAEELINSKKEWFYCPKSEYKQLKEN